MQAQYTPALQVVRPYRSNDTRATIACAYPYCFTQYHELKLMTQQAHQATPPEGRTEVTEAMPVEREHYRGGLAKQGSSSVPQLPQLPQQQHACFSKGAASVGGMHKSRSTSRIEWSRTRQAAQV